MNFKHFVLSLLCCTIEYLHTSPSLSLHYTCIDVHSSSVDDVKCITVDPITTTDVITAISHTKPSSVTGLNNKYTSWQKQYESY